MVMQTLRLSYPEMERLKVIGRHEHKALTVMEAAQCLKISERQMYRILKRYRTEGEAGLLHRLRGRASNKAYPPQLITKVLRLYREQYSDYGPTLFLEKLELYHDLSISRQTATRWLTQKGLWSGNRKKRPHRTKRERRACIGSLIQFDGSFHDWFEGRGPQCCLLVAIDDASGRLMVRFAAAEDTPSVLAFWHHYIQPYGIPAEVYTDGGSVYFDPNDPKRLTQFGRAVAALAITHIRSHSPQARGRVERSNRTHQDRLIKALREQNIATIDQANRFLETFYTNDHNQRFAHTDGLADVHRPADGINLNNIFCFEHTRHVYNDWTITLDGHYFQLLRSDAPLPPPRSKVIVRQWLDGSLHIFWNEHELAYEHCPAAPKRPPQSTIARRPPAHDHPWRTKHVGGVAAQRRRQKTLASKQTVTYNELVSAKPRTKNRRKDSARYAHSVFPSSDTSP